jgi:sugar phosphate isomerase/epimerase
MSFQFSRRQFSATIASGVAASMLAGNSRHLFAHEGHDHDEEGFSISLAEWSFHKTLFAGELDNLDFSKAAKEMGIDAVEYVNQFFKDKAEDTKYIAEMKSRNEDLGVKTLLIMIDGEGDLGAATEKGRIETVDRHKKWIVASKELGGHSIRVNARSTGSYAEQSKRAADGLRMLSEFAAPMDMNVLVENHGGLSSSGKWLSETIAAVGLENCGTLPDFGNFVINGSKNEEYDRYQGVTELMPYAKAVSAKSHDFDADGNETQIDYKKIMEIVLAADYHGYVGIEYEGSQLSEKEGIMKTKQLLESVREELVG